MPRGSNLNFFVLISSVNGIFGNRSQADYSAGSTVKDALAYHRITHGQKAISIDLGLMVNQWLVVENDKLLAGMRRLGHLIDIHMRQLLALMEHYCDPDLRLLSHGKDQVIVGIETPPGHRPFQRKVLTCTCNSSAHIQPPICD